MNTDLEKELQESIKKNLPQQVGEVLKARLEQADKDVLTIISLTDQLRVKNDIVNSLNQTLEDYRKFDQRNATLEAREKAVSEKENKLEVDTLTYQLTAEKDKTKFSQEVALGLVRNTSYRKTVFDNESGPNGTDQYGNSLYANVSKNTSETKTEE